MSGGGSPTLRQNHYRFRVDGSDREATPTWGAAEDTTYYPGQDTPFRLRFAVDNTGTAAAATGPWPAYSLNGGAYTLINASSSVVRIQDASSGGVSANIATANLRLTAGSGSSAIGRYFDAVTAVSKIAAGTYTEYEYGLLIRDADVAPGDTIDFRLYDSDGTALGTAYSTYNVTPRVTIPTALSAAPSATSYSFSNDASDLTGASVNKKLVTAGATSGTWAGQSLVSQSVNSGNSVVDGSFFTESGVPSTNGSNLSGTIIVVSIDITTGNSNLRRLTRSTSRRRTLAPGHRVIASASKCGCGTTRPAPASRRRSHTTAPVLTFRRKRHRPLGPSRPTLAPMPSPAPRPTLN
jgi:hypothetical protein